MSKEWSNTPGSAEIPDLSANLCGQTEIARPGERLQGTTACRFSSRRHRYLSAFGTSNTRIGTRDNTK